MNAAKRPQDRWYLRYIGPEDRLYGEFRGQLVELLSPPAGSDIRVRFPDGSVSFVHEDHLTDALVRGKD